ncbi:MAG TPA: hypothetical protein IAC36_07260 [Candidatus Aphodomonas merdavium]|nr:hypothetical protein [Candidatus Aphodomonas merdavium]
MRKSTGWIFLPLAAAQLTQPWFVAFLLGNALLLDANARPFIVHGDGILPFFPDAAGYLQDGAFAGNAAKASALHGARAGVRIN